MAKTYKPMPGLFKVRRRNGVIETKYFPSLSDAMKYASKGKGASTWRVKAVVSSE